MIVSIKAIKGIKKSSLIIGFLLGVLSTSIFAGVFYSHASEDKYILDAQDLTFTALSLNAGREKEWISNFEANLPSYTSAIDENFRDRPNAISALWMLKAYVAKTGLDVPHETKAIFNSLPEKPPTSCQLKLRELEDTNPNLPKN